MFSCVTVFSEISDENFTKIIKFRGCLGAIGKGRYIKIYTKCLSSNFQGVMQTNYNKELAVILLTEYHEQNFPVKIGGKILTLF
ncbi:hypothetical protein Riv7116_3614 [Rivularia sp. PCC 7116]|uniref:hypothetical protein n=1 Tax=Rivularia sp. PCC 7116 TaxID=373994 RepID=UPI00029ED645|nr:hypothetical protein [Rivularia sp. PCC 7116]AFY56064.1 hypothetical protein Riv7116_3614 [Rivularia sp. PCC 7116]